MNYIFDIAFGLLFFFCLFGVCFVSMFYQTWGDGWSNFEKTIALMTLLACIFGGMIALSNFL